MYSKLYRLREILIGNFIFVAFNPTMLDVPGLRTLPCDVVNSYNKYLVDVLTGPRGRFQYILKNTSCQKDYSTYREDRRNRSIRNMQGLDNPRNVAANFLDSDIVVSKFEPQSGYHVLLQVWLWH